MLTQIAIDVDDTAAIPAEVAGWIAVASQSIQTFQDRWDREQSEQFVACDFAHVYRVLARLRQTQWLSGNQFCEWGCGFGLVACMAAQLGWNVVAIEAEATLVAQAERLTATTGQRIQLLHGNFLPAGAEDLADDPYHPSLGHAEPSVYEANDLSVDDFDVIYAYPWPGEEHFLQDVFEHYGRFGSFLVLFCGPNDVRVLQKVRRA